MNYSPPFDALVEWTNALVFAVNSKGYITFVNPAITNFLGFAQNELVGKDIGSFVKERQKHIVRDAIGNAVNEKSAIPIAFVLQTKSGDESTVEGKIIPKLEHGEVVGAWLFLRDRIAARLVENRREINIFFRTLLHEITGIYQELTATLEIVLQEANLYSDLENLVYDAISEVVRGVRLLSSINGLIEIMVGEIEKKPVDPRTALDAALKDARKDYIHRNIVINTTMNKNEYLVEAGDKLKDVFYALLISSIESTPTTNEVQIEVKSRLAKPDLLVLEVIDFGCGLSDQEKDVLFKINSGGRNKLLGLSLTYAREMLKFYGGSLQVKNRVETDYSQGTKFIVTLPLSRRN